MKNAFKKLFSFMLVAVMLVSVLPVTAMAAETAGSVDLVIVTEKTKGEAYLEGEWVTANLNAEGKLSEEEFARLQDACPTDITGWKNEKGEPVNIATEDLTAYVGGNLYRSDFKYVEGDTEEPDETPVDPAPPVEEDKDVVNYIDVILNKKTSNWTEDDYVRVEVVNGKVSDEDFAELQEICSSDIIGWSLTPGATSGEALNKMTFNHAAGTAINVYPVFKGGNEEKPDPEPIEGEYILHDTLNDKIYNLKVEDGKYDAPNPTHKGYKFMGWRTEENGGGKSLETVVANHLDYKNFYSWYIKSNDDDVSTLNVYARLYVGGKNTKTVKVLSRVLDEDTKVLKWLDDHEEEIDAAVKTSTKIPDEFVWGHYDEERYYYDSEGKEVLTSQNLKMTADRDVVIKLYSTKEPTVQVYVHRKLNESADRIIQMNGYSKGDVVSYDEVLTAVKKYYNVKEMKGLYDENKWEDLRDERSVKGSNNIDVNTADGLVKIHVLLDGSAKSSNKADSSNPKTGDSMFMVMTVMALSATALAGAYIYNKKWMVK